MRIIRVLGVALALIVCLPTGVYAVPAGQPNVVISEIQVANDEFIELYNNEATAVSLTGWRLEYRTASQASSWNTKPATSLSGEIGAHGHYIVALASYLPTRNTEITTTLANTGGHVRLVKPAAPGSGEQVIDLVGWGNAEAPETAVMVAPKAGFSVQRCSVSGQTGDSDNNANDFAELQPLTPGSLASCAAPEPETPPAPSTSCQGLVMSEVLPNAAGSDTGQEFIELYNPTTDVIDLSGCGLQLAGNEYIYRFDSQTLAPEEYRAFSDTLTGIILPNSSGGQIYLLSAADEELQSLSYPGELPDDVAWAWFGEADWQQTYISTPNAINIAQPTEPCAAGQTRSQESGRCVDEAGSVTGLKPCEPGQERNPETNRCRSLNSLASVLAACKAGQERNPETNRCRAVASAASGLKPCAAGQERNPETNRCRKVAGAASGSNDKVKDVEAATSSTTNWWLAGIAATGAVGYGLWEWRRDIAGFISRLSRKVTSTAQ